MDAQSKFAIHAACREGKRESDLQSITHASGMTCGLTRLTPHSCNGPVPPERESIWNRVDCHEREELSD